MRYISQYASYGIVQIHTLKYKHLQVKRLTRREYRKTLTRDQQHI
jgi:hypothetical protein